MHGRRVLLCNALTRLKFIVNVRTNMVYIHIKRHVFVIGEKDVDYMKHITEYIPKPSSPCTCLNIRRASRGVTQFYDKVLEPSGLTVTQLSLLRHVEQLGPIAISELAKAMRIDRTTLNRNLKPLVDAGLLVINPGNDSRVKHVLLSEVGKTVIVKAWVLWEEAQAALKEYLGEEDLATLVKLLARVEALE